MNQVDRNQTLLQLQVSLPKRVILTVLIMAMLIMFVFFFNIPNPNMILIAGLVICSALFGYGGGVVAGVIMFFYTPYFFSTGHSFTEFTPENLQKVGVSLVGIAVDMVFVCALKRAEMHAFAQVDACICLTCFQQQWKRDAFPKTREKERLVTQGGR
jgi:K+-sensing histidine kinase KdpD